jgi:hypothetical protein
MAGGFAAVTPGDPLGRAEPAMVRWTASLLDRDACAYSGARRSCFRTRMANHERQPDARRPAHDRLRRMSLPPELAEFLQNVSAACLLQASDWGTVAVIKLPRDEIERVRGTLPIDVGHALHDHPSSPVLRTTFTLYDDPADPLVLETFTNIDDPSSEPSSPPWPSRRPSGCSSTTRRSPIA